MRIACPYCGERDQQEFACLGDASLRRPDGMDAQADAVADYVHLRDNPAGAHREFWHHASGCHAWLIVTRDTLTHAVMQIEAAKDVRLRDREAS
jgi:heterotetrameric sarcosine oxidase delta subunit